MKDNLVKINLNDIDSFEGHPFSVNKDDSLKELVHSIKLNGLLNPMIVRKKDNGRYEMISGHRRKTALEILGISESEVIVKELNGYEKSGMDIVEIDNSNSEYTFKAIKAGIANGYFYIGEEDFRSYYITVTEADTNDKIENTTLTIK